MDEKWRDILRDMRDQLERDGLQTDEAVSRWDRINGALGCEPGCECEA